MRILKEKDNIDYNNTIGFFERRASKYNKENPYSVTMYQDNHPSLVSERNKKEVQLLKPLLCLDSTAKVLDIACGIGRWSDAINEEISEYTGIDFCKELIEIAKERNADSTNRHFITGSSTNLRKHLPNKDHYFNRILLIGALVYINDNDLLNTLMEISGVASKNTLILIREPIAIKERLTLKEQFSEELNDNYNAIYRTRDELISFFRPTLLDNGFKIIKEDWLFHDSNLNNRKETSQYFFVLSNERNG